jgi:hypothetical protein
MPDVHSIDAVTEKEFQSVVIDAARLFHWSVWHVPDSRMQAGGKLVGSALAAGLPDLILVHRAFGFVFAELKRQKGKIRPVQEKALGVMAEAAGPASLTGCKVRVHLWRPSDMDDVVFPLLKYGKGPVVYGID